MNNPLVSIVIPTSGRNENVLRQVLQTIKDSTYKNVETIVVNEGKERSAQRNIGIKKAKGDYIMYLDDDQLVSSGLIEECVELARCGYSALYIPETIITKGFFAYLRNWERQFYTATPIDCVRFMRKNCCPMFNEGLNGPEDSDHDRKVPGIRATTHERIYHLDRVNFISFLQKKAYYARSMAYFKTLHPNDRVLDPVWRCFGVYFERGKWKRVLRRPDLFICLMGLIFLRGVIYLWQR